jgi:hypothetical protein
MQLERQSTTQIQRMQCMPRVYVISQPKGQTSPSAINDQAGIFMKKKVPK